MYVIDMIEFHEDGIPLSHIHYSFRPIITTLYKESIVAETKDGPIEVKFERMNLNVPKYLSKRVEEVWEEKKRSGQRLFNGIIANLMKYRCVNNVVEWEEGLTDFKSLTFLRSGGLSDLNERYRSYILRRVAPTAVGAITETGDNKLLIGVRGRSLAMGGKMMFFPCGHPRYIFEAEYLEVPTQALARQFVTEANFPLYSSRIDEVYGPIENISVIGLVRGIGSIINRSGSWNPLIIFHIETDWNEEQHRNAWKTLADKWEHEKIFFISTDEDKFTNFITRHVENFNDNGIGEVLVYGRFKFGDDWYSKICRELVREHGLILTELPGFYSC